MIAGRSLGIVEAPGRRATTRDLFAGSRGMRTELIGSKGWLMSRTSFDRPPRYRGLTMKLLSSRRISTLALALLTKITSLALNDWDTGGDDMDPAEEEAR